MLEKEKEKARKWLRLKEGVNQMAIRKFKEMQDRLTRSAEKEKKVSKFNKEEEKKKRDKIKK